MPKLRTLNLKSTSKIYITVTILLMYVVISCSVGTYIHVQVPASALHLLAIKLTQWSSLVPIIFTCTQKNKRVTDKFVLGDDCLMVFLELFEWNVMEGC